jgi:hypothetical protein
MKKKTSPNPDELRPEYGPELFHEMKRNRFAGEDLVFKGRRAVVLDQDVADVFDTPEAVNTMLRSVIRAMRTAAPAASRTPRTKRRAS